MVNFPTCIPDSYSNIPPLLHFFLSSDTSICSTMVLPSLGNFGSCCNFYKRVVEPRKLAYPTKTKESITSQKLGSQNFCF